jgi:hypothetical protein
MNGSNTTAEGRASMVGLLLRKLPAAGMGVIAAVATVIALDRWRAHHSPAPSVSKEAAPVAAPAPAAENGSRRVIVDNRAFDRIAELERRLRELEAAQTAPAVGSAALEQPPPDPQETRRKVDELYAELDRAHERDAADPEWAPRATKGFASGLTALGEKLGFTVGPLDCKTTTCRADVNWGDYDAARTKGAQLVEEYYGGLNCLQRIRLGPPADPSAPYSTRLYLDCTAMRAGAAEEIRTD